MRVTCLGLLLATLAGCGLQRYAAAPLDAEATPRALAAARLDDAELAARLARLGVAPEAEWSPRDLGLVAALRSADLAAARAAVQTARAARRVAAQRRNPLLGLTLERNTDRNNGTRLNFGPSLEFTLSPPSRRRLLVALADSDVRDAVLAALDQAWQARDAGWRAAEALRAAREQRERLAAAAAAREATLAVARGQVAAGLREAFEWQTLALDANDARLATLERARALALTESAAEGALTLADGALAAVQLRADVDAALDDFATLQRVTLESHPRVLAALAAYQRAEQGLALAISAQYPDVQLTPGYFLLQADSLWSLFGGVVVPVFASQDAAIDEARRAREAAAAAFHAAQSSALIDLRAAFAAWRAEQEALTEARALATRIEADARHLATRAAEGVVDDLLAARARQQQVEVALHVAEAEGRVRLARCALEQASRAPGDDAAFARLLDETLEDAAP
ncbi:MAG: TolC family protein [Gammaproteobacteria bacterium]